MRSADGVETGLLTEEVFAAAIRLINRELLPEASAKRQRIYGKVTHLLATLQRKAARQARRAGSQLAAIPETRCTELSIRAWGLLLRRRRDEAGLTRAQLAALAGVADSTIRNIETGRHAPTRAITLRLQSVPALRLPALFTDLSIANNPVGAAPDALHGHCWITPDCDAIEQSRELARLLNGRGGRLDPALLFFEPASAATWCALSSIGERLRERASMPLPAVAQAVSAHFSGASIDVLGLGAGTAHAEASLALALLGFDITALRLLLLDASPSLLTAGFRHASSALAGLSRASCFTIQGDMRKLPSYAPLVDLRHRRLACLFGDTFNALDNEASFVRHSLGALQPGDLLLLDVPLALAAPESEPHLQPGALSRDEASGLLVEFLAGPLSRHPGIHKVELFAALDPTARTIPGSYAIEYQALVRIRNREPRRFSLCSLKRYDLARLVESLDQMGWHLVERWPFGESPRPRALLLLQKCV